MRATDPDVSVSTHPAPTVQPVPDAARHRALAASKSASTAVGSNLTPGQKELAPLEALAKLAVQRKRLRGERKEIDAYLEETADAPALAVEVATDPEKFNLSAAGYAQLGQFLAKRKKVTARLGRIATLEGIIQKDGAVIRRYVDASKEEVQQAIKTYQEQLTAAEHQVTAGAMGVHINKVKHTKAKREFSRLSLPGEVVEEYDKDILQMLDIAAD